MLISNSDGILSITYILTSGIPEDKKGNKCFLISSVGFGGNCPWMLPVATCPDQTWLTSFGGACSTSSEA